MLKILFKPEESKYKSATDEYFSIWESEKEKIIGGFEVITGLKFPQIEIEVIVFEGVSFSGNENTPMKLRASYSLEEKKGTLIHELGHRLILKLENRINDIDEHHTLNLFLYDTWVYIYGEDFANNMVSIESKRKGKYDYESAWKWALNMSKEERKILFDNIKSLNPSSNIRQ